MKDYNKLLNDLAVQRESLEKEQAEFRGRKKFLCAVCNEMHSITSCEAKMFPVVRHVEYNRGAIYIKCPKEGKYNRCVFDTSYENRCGWIRSTEDQFYSIYTPLFKSFTVSAENKPLQVSMWENNYYFDQNHKKFDLV